MTKWSALSFDISSILFPLGIHYKLLQTYGICIAYNAPFPEPPSTLYLAPHMTRQPLGGCSPQCGDLTNGAPRDQAFLTLDVSL